MQIRQLQHFVTLAESTTLTEAARRLGMSQQGLSASIARLEGEIGLTLMQRRRKTVHLTAAGVHFADGARAVLRSVAAMLDQAQAADRSSAQGDHGLAPFARSPSAAISR